MTLPPVQPVNPLENLDRHWAVKVVTPEDRASTVRYAMGVLTRLCNGDPPAATEALPDFVVPLAGAYAIAASEWLDFEGAASPTAILSVEQRAQRAAHIEAGADRAFVLTAALPVDPSPPERVAVLYRTLLLAGLAQLGNKQTEFRQWLKAYEPLLFPRTENDTRWDLILLRRVVELWTHVLRGAGPSGLEHAMEIIASIREERPARDDMIVAAADALEQNRLRFFLFTLFHLTEAATELLLFRVHGEPARVESRLYSHFTLARDAAGGDPRLDASFDWLYEASRRTVELRTAQLELLPEASA
ncbi:MAG TPA: hypothetical protein VNS10_17500 [Gemmatimonadaceae bacterium]|jgi:hypothetical protein|nr:hypothetical protein [Gemmatimonadaceae bacterium]